MLDPKQAIINTGGFEAVNLKIADISANDEVEEKTSPSGETYEIEYPYTIQIKSGKKVITNDRTTRVLKPKEWFRKFYIAHSAKGDEFPAFTRDHNLLAVSKIYEKVKGVSIGKTFNLLDLIDFEFEGFLVELKERAPFIDWVSTFEHNGVEVPTVEDLYPPQEKEQRRAIDRAFKSEPVKTEKIEEEAGIDDLPF